MKPDYGLPEGWVYIKTIGKVPHACELCKVGMDPKTLGSGVDGKLIRDIKKH